MSSGRDHRLMAAASAFTAAAVIWKPEDHWVKHPLVAAGLGAGCGTLPDLLEPALHPNHRQFFHSVVFAALVGVGLYKAYNWEPQSTSESILRTIVLIGGVSYLVHLAMDSATRKSLPLMGRLP
jgi:inner membrane protein